MCKAKTPCAYCGNNATKVREKKVKIELTELNGVPTMGIAYMHIRQRKCLNCKSVVYFDIINYSTKK